MKKLISAEFLRLFHSRIYRVCLFLSAGMGLFAVLFRWWQIQIAGIYYDVDGWESIDSLLFSGNTYLIFIMAVFVGLFVGTEYSERTISNKLIAGYRRQDIYLSEYVVCAVANLILAFLYVLVVLLIGMFLIHNSSMNPLDFLLLTGKTAMAILAMSALFLLISLSIPKRTAGLLGCLLVTLLISSAANHVEYYIWKIEYCEELIAQGWVVIESYEEYIEYEDISYPVTDVYTYTYDENEVDVTYQELGEKNDRGNTESPDQESSEEEKSATNHASGYVWGLLEIDPDSGEIIVEEIGIDVYLTGWKRDVCEFLDDALPICQLLQIASNDAEHLPRMALYDCMIILFATGVGCVIFRRINLQ